MARNANVRHRAWIAALTGQSEADVADVIQNGATIKGHLNIEIKESELIRASRRC